MKNQLRFIVFSVLAFNNVWAQPATKKIEIANSVYVVTWAEANVSQPWLPMPQLLHLLP